MKNTTIALFERQLDMVVVEIVLELLPFQREVARQIGLAVGQEERRAAFERHVALGDGALQGQHRREPVHMRREAARSPATDWKPR